MDVSNMQFNEDFQIFKSRMKELDKRLGSVISQSFEDNDSFISRMKLLDSFEEILERNLIEDEIFKK
jgi:dynein heavy chain